MVKKYRKLVEDLRMGNLAEVKKMLNGAHVKNLLNYQMPDGLYALGIGCVLGKTLMFDRTIFVEEEARYILSSVAKLLDSMNIKYQIKSYYFDGIQNHENGALHIVLDKKNLDKLKRSAKIGDNEV